MQKQTCRFVTLTLAHRDEPLKDALTRLRAAWIRLRQSKCWKKYVTGGVVVCEIKRSNAGKWHAHLHCIVSGSFLPQKELSEAWLKITGDSYIVDVRIVSQPHKAAGYIAKYVTKAAPIELLQDAKVFAEYAAAIQGSRSFARFGKWEKPPELNDAEDIGEWVTVATVVEVAMAAARQERWAVDILRHLMPADQKPRERPPPEPTDHLWSAFSEKGETKSDNST